MNNSMPSCRSCGRYVMHGDCLCEDCLQEESKELETLRAENARLQKAVDEARFLLTACIPFVDHAVEGIPLARGLPDEIDAWLAVNSKKESE